MYELDLIESGIMKKAGGTRKSSLFPCIGARPHDHLAEHGLDLFTQAGGVEVDEEDPLE